MRRAVERRERADPLQVVKGRMVAGKKEMIPVVDAAAEFRIKIGPTTTARVISRFVQPDGITLGGKPNCGGESGEPGADDVHPAPIRSRFHKKP